MGGSFFYAHKGTLLDCLVRGTSSICINREYFLNKGQSENQALFRATSSCNLQSQETVATHHLRDIDIITHDWPELSFLQVSIELRGARAMLLSKGRATPELAQTLLKCRYKDWSDPKDVIHSLVGLSSAYRDP